MLLILECFFIGLRSIHIKSTHYEGIVVEANNIEATEKAIRDICEKKRCNDEEYIVAYSKKFDMQKKFSEYIELYATVSEE